MFFIFFFCHVYIKLQEIKAQHTLKKKKKTGRGMS